MASSGFDSSSEEDESRLNPTTPLKLDWLDFSAIGYTSCVAISELPGCKFRDTWRNLKSDLLTVVNANITSVYVLLTKGELKKYRVSNLLEEYENHGIDVHHYPFTDGSVPPIQTVMDFIYDLKRDLEKKNKILIHCYGGLGRSCVVAACFMMHYDDSLSSDGVIDIFRSVRGPGAIQTVKQYNFIQEFRKLREENDQNSHDDSRSLSR